MNTIIWNVVIFVFAIQNLRYIFMAGGSYYYLYIWNKDKYLKRKVQAQEYPKGQAKREIINSIWFAAFSASISAIPFIPALEPYSKLYDNPDAYSTLWLWIQIPILIMINDTYFYWMHRTLHSNSKLYKLIHKEHHASSDPSPLTSHSFHWIEAILEVSWFVPLMFMIPFNHLALLAFGFITLMFNINGHLGVDLFPQSWRTNPVMKWINTSTHHNNHHRYYRGNYSFYFTFWDKVMKTEMEPKVKKPSQFAA